MAKKSNPLLEQAKRKAEMQQMAEMAKGEEQTAKRKLTLLLPEDDIAKIKKIAIDQKSSVSEMVSLWIRTFE